MVNTDKIDKIDKINQEEYSRANDLLQVAYRKYELDVFLSRLLFAFPILIIRNFSGD